MHGGSSAAFRLFGRLRVVVGESESDLPQGGPAALLAYLLLQPSDPVNRDRLIDAIWGESPPRSAVNAIHVYVSALRRVLGSSGDVLQTTEQGYVLAVERGAVDVHRFRDLVRDGRRALDKHEHSTAVRLVDEALALWVGPPFAGLERWSFVAGEADELEELRLDALEVRLEAALELGRHREVAAEVAGLIAQQPLRENLRAIRMLALYRSGRQAEALAAYGEARRVLGEELGIEPGRRLKDLEAAMLRQDDSLEPGPTHVAPLLPVPPLEVIGRAVELAHADAAFRSGTRLMSLVGPGGIGKTRLALEIGRRLEHEFPATLVALESVTEPDLLENAIVAALGLNASQPLIEQLDDRPRLLLLDNFEQIVEAAPLLATILGATTSLRMIVTSRTVLRLTGEEVLHVPPLGRDEAVALFFRRAGAVGGTIDEDAERATVEAICDCLDDLPLAIELAAARTKLFAPPTLLERLSRRLDVLTSGARDAPARQRTMRATVDWSFRLLTPREQSLLETLAVFVGGASPDAAAVVGEESPTELADVVESLVDNSLIEVTSREPLRLRMLEVVREYALEKTHGTERGAAIRARHAKFFSDFVDAAEVRLESSAQRDAAVDLEREHDNIRAALAYELETDALAAVRMAAALRHFWRIHGHFREGCRWLEEVVARGARADADPGSMSKVYNGLGILSGEQGELDRAREAFDEALRYARLADDSASVARVVANLGNLALYRGDYPEARVLYTEALEINRRYGHVELVPMNVHNLGATLLCEGEFEAARPVLEESLDLARQIGAPHAFAAATREYARVLVLVDETEQAIEHIVRSLEIGLELDDVNGVAQSIELVAGLVSRLGKDDSAQEAFALAQTLRRIVGGRAAPDEVRWLEMTGFQAPPGPITPGGTSEPALAEAATRAVELLDSAAVRAM